MRKSAKTITVAAGLLATITGNVAAKSNTTTFDSVRETVNIVHSLANKEDDASIHVLFDKVLQLSQKINQLNANLIKSKFAISAEQFAFLATIRDLLDLNSTILVNKHEARIMAEFRMQYRAYTNSIIELDYSIARVKEKLGLVKVLDIDGLTMSETELAQINHAAQERATK